MPIASSTNTRFGVSTTPSWTSANGFHSVISDSDCDRPSSSTGNVSISNPYGLTSAGRAGRPRPPQAG